HLIGIAGRLRVIEQQHGANAPVPKSHYCRAGRDRARIDTSPVATSVSALLWTAETSARHTVVDLVLERTRPLPMNFSPRAGASTFPVKSLVASISCSGTSVNAAAPAAKSSSEPIGPA